jgi:hypothetical protein
MMEKSLIENYCHFGKSCCQANSCHFGQSYFLIASSWLWPATRGFGSPKLAQRHCHYVYPEPVAPPLLLLQLVLAARGSESQSSNTAEPAHWYAHTGRTGSRRKHWQASAVCGQRPCEPRATGTAAGPRVDTATPAPLLLLLLLLPRS